MGALLGYDFPGNARELRNMVERAVILARGGTIQAKHIFLPTPTVVMPAPSLAANPSDSEAARISQALDDCRWNRREAAKTLGMPYSTLRYKMRKLGL